MKRADVLFAETTGLVQFNGAGTNYVIRTLAGVLYLVYIDAGRTSPSRSPRMAA